MKTLLIAVLMITLCCSYVAAQATEEHHVGPPAPKILTQHEMLKKDVGVWDAEMKMWMGGPDSEPMVMPAVEKNRMMDGNLWLMSEFESGPFKGFGQIGYDPIQKKFVGTWVDNMSPHLNIMKGNREDNGDVVMYSEGYNAQTGEPEKMKSVTKEINDDQKDFFMYKKVGDEWVKSFEIKYKRRQGA